MNEDEILAKFLNGELTKDDEYILMPDIFRRMSDDLKTAQVCKKALSWYFDDESVYDYIPKSLGEAEICRISLEYHEERISEMLKYKIPFVIIANQISLACKSLLYVPEEELTKEIYEKAVNIFKLAQSWIMTKHSKEGKGERQMKVKAEFEDLIAVVGNNVVKCIAYECEREKDGLITLARVVKSFKDEELKAKVRTNVSPKKWQLFHDYLSDKSGNAEVLSEQDKEIVEAKVNLAFKNISEKGNLYCYNPDDFIDMFIDTVKPMHSDTPNGLLREVTNFREFARALFGFENAEKVYPYLKKYVAESVKEELTRLKWATVREEEIDGETHEIVSGITKEEVYDARRRLMAYFANWQNNPREHDI